MKDTISMLNNELANYEKKWSAVVRNVIKENAALKSENNRIKRKLTSFKSVDSLASTAGSLA